MWAFRIVAVLGTVLALVMTSVSCGGGVISEKSTETVPVAPDSDVDAPDQLRAALIVLARGQIRPVKWAELRARQSRRMRDLIDAEGEALGIQTVDVKAPPPGYAWFQHESELAFKRVIDLAQSMECSDAFCGLCRPDSADADDLLSGLDFGSADVKHKGKTLIDVDGAQLEATELVVTARVRLETVCHQTVNLKTGERSPPQEYYTVAARYGVQIADDAQLEGWRHMLRAHRAYWSDDEIASDDGYTRGLRPRRVFVSGGRCFVRTSEIGCNEQNTTTWWVDGRVLRYTFLGHDQPLRGCDNAGCGFLSRAVTLSVDGSPSIWMNPELPPLVFATLYDRSRTSRSP